MADLKSTFIDRYRYPISEAEYQANLDHEIGWYTAMARRIRWDRITLGRPLSDDDELRQEKLALCQLKLVPLWAEAMAVATGKEGSFGYSRMTASIELPTEEWLEIVETAKEGGIDYMLDNFFDEHIPIHMILGR